METHKRSMPYKWMVMIVVSMGTLLSTIDMGGMRVILPILEQFFKTSPDVVVWASLIWVLVGSSLMLSMARIVAIVGRKKLYLSGLVIFTVGLALCSISQSIMQLVLSRFLQSVGAAMTIAIEYAIVTASFPSDERGKALGIMGAVAGLGLLAGPALSGYCIDLLGWRSFFYIRIPFVVITAIMAQVVIKGGPTKKNGVKFDLPGAIIFFFAFSSLYFTLTQGSRLGWGSPLIISIACAAVVLLIAFVIIEKRTSQPVLDMRIFRNRILNIAIIGHIVLYISTNAVSFALPFFLIDGQGYSASAAGLLLVTIPATTLVFSPLSGKLSDTLGTFALCMGGLILLSLGLWLSYRMTIDTSLIAVIFYSIFIGAGMGFFTAPNTSAIIGAVPAESLDSASAMAGTLRHIGMAIGLAVSGSVFTVGRSSSVSRLALEGIHENMIAKLSTIDGFQDTMLVALFIGAAGIIASLFRGERRNRQAG